MYIFCTWNCFGLLPNQRICSIISQCWQFRGSVTATSLLSLLAFFTKMKTFSFRYKQVSCNRINIQSLGCQVLLFNGQGNPQGYYCNPQGYQCNPQSYTVHPWGYHGHHQVYQGHSLSCQGHPQGYKDHHRGYQSHPLYYKGHLQGNLEATKAMTKVT